MEINKRPTLALAHKRVKLTPDSRHFLCVFSKLGVEQLGTGQLGVEKGKVNPLPSSWKLPYAYLNHHRENASGERKCRL